MQNKEPRQQVILAIRTDRPAGDGPAPDVVLFMTPVGSAFSDDSAGDGDDEDEDEDEDEAASMLVRLSARRRRVPVSALPPTPPASVPAERPQRAVSSAAAVSARRRRPEASAFSLSSNRARPPAALLERLTPMQRARRWFAIAGGCARVLGHLQHGAVERAGAALLATVAFVEQSMWALGLLPAARYRAALRRHGRVGVPGLRSVVVVGGGGGGGVGAGGRGGPAADDKRAFWLRMHALARGLFAEHTRRVHLYNAAYGCGGGEEVSEDGEDGGDEDGDHDVDSGREDADIDSDIDSESDSSSSASPPGPPAPDVLSTQTLVRLHKAVGVLHARLYGSGHRRAGPRRRGRRPWPDLPPRVFFRSLAETVLFQIDNTAQPPPSATADLWV